MQRTDPVTATAIETTVDALVVILGDRRVSIPWEKCSERLLSATAQERMEAELSPGGYGIHWRLIDEDLSVNGLLRSGS